MKSKHVFTKILPIMCALAMFATASLFWHGSSSKGKRLADLDIFLSKPAFAQEAEQNFLEKEAGIAAYANLNQQVSPAKARAVFRVIEKETDNYIIGSVPVLGYEDDTTKDIHCFVHRDGWVVAYYLSDEPTSKIMYWKNWDGKQISTKIEEGLTSVSNVITGTVASDIKYYHFKYPNANRLMVIADKDSFRLTIPSELVIYERSFSARSGYYTGYLKIDGQQLPSDLGLITLAQLKPDTPHDIGSRYGGVVFLIYQES